MPVTKTVLKNTNLEAVVKVAGTPATTPSATIDLDVDLVPATQVASGTQRVNIAGVTYSGAAGGVITITRNSVVIMTLLADTNGNIDFTGQDMIPDSIENDQDIVVTASGAQVECWLRLKKVDGYSSKIEPEQFGIYDNTTTAGS
jgi:hypothetical protein